MKTIQKVKLTKKAKIILATIYSAPVLFATFYVYCIIEHDVRHLTTNNILHLKEYAQAYHTKFNEWPESIDQLHFHLAKRAQESVKGIEKDLDAKLYISGSSCKIEYTYRPFAFRATEIVRERKIESYRLEDYFNDHIPE